MFCKKGIKIQSMLLENNFLILFFLGGGLASTESLDKVFTICLLMRAVLNLQNNLVIVIQWLGEIILRWTHDCLHFDLDTWNTVHVDT